MKAGSRASVMVAEDSEGWGRGRGAYRTELIREESAKDLLDENRATTSTVSQKRRFEQGNDLDMEENKVNILGKFYPTHSHAVRTVVSKKMLDF